MSRNRIRAFSILQKHGFSGEDAESFLEAIETDESNYATKGDIRELKGELKAGITILKSEIQTVKFDVIVELHKELNNQTYKFLGLLITLGGIVTLILKGWSFLKL